MEKALIYSYLLDGKGGGKSMTAEEITQWQPSDGLLWVHLDYSVEGAPEWIFAQKDLPNVCAQALLHEETRPRATLVGSGILMSLRGVNLNPSADPEDMVSIRVYADKNRIISTRHRRLLTVADIVTSLDENRGPKDSGEFIQALVRGLTLRMETTIDMLEERTDDLEDTVIAGGKNGLRSELSAVRRAAIMLRRYLAPQREALSRLCGEQAPWLTETHRIGLRETSDHLLRLLENLDSARDRAAVVQEELVNHMSEQMNQRMYVLSLVAAIFLPLGFLTGLLGINVGGIPGAENNQAFFWFIAILCSLTALQVVVFKRFKWM
ncbi:zinc transporter ZntB [Saccharophagus degradans]|uniref:Zinc transporter ZntB n=1 Tax=Saccharophagus degradans TaxID=86304 RepID=A0AAW7XE71_9GAMM|nr:zinc transporter ZntB [Saccharophagus degradans]MDO6424843.1 zinc transporter ZntB [Saccharophagus degradans]MDO6606631.1 zinc transporter ZntB [Saccharophagus degradans]